jgi:hypothetical protein
MEIKEDIKIHDFRFEVKLDVNIESMYASIMSVTIYYIGVDPFGLRLSPGGTTYVLDAYMDELESQIDDIVERLEL